MTDSRQRSVRGARIATFWDMNEISAPSITAPGIEGSRRAPRGALLLLATLSFLSLRATIAQSDATVVEPKDGNPLSWTGNHEVQLTLVAGPAGAALHSGPDPTYTVVKRAVPGEPLLVVGERNDFFAVLVPAGYHAFVNREYVALDPDGTGSIRGDAVNLRPKPSLEADYPIGRLESGRDLEVIGAADAEEKWLEIMAPGDIPLWVPYGEVEIIGDLSDATYLAKVATARQARHDDWIASSPDARLATAQRVHDDQLRERLDAIDRDLLAERERGADADFTALRAQLAAIITEASSDGLRTQAEARLADIDGDERRVVRERAMRAEAERLQSELEMEKQRLADAQRKAAEDAKNTVGPRVAVGDQTSMIAFLRKKGDGSKVVYSLERGNTVLTRVTSSNGRYRLEDFVGMQIEITGRYIGGGVPPTLEVERLVIQKR